MTYRDPSREVVAMIDEERSMFEVYEHEPHSGTQARYDAGYRAGSAGRPADSEDLTYLAGWRNARDDQQRAGAGF